MSVQGQCACEREAQVLGFLCLFQLNAVDLVHCIDGLALVCDPYQFALIRVKVHLAVNRSSNPVIC